MLYKYTKTQVNAAVRRDGKWSGWVCQNKVPLYHIAHGWCLGMQVTFVKGSDGAVNVKDQDICVPKDERDAHGYVEFHMVPKPQEDFIDQFLYYNSDPEHGDRIAFYATTPPKKVRQ